MTPPSCVPLPKYSPMKVLAAKPTPMDSRALLMTPCPPIREGAVSKHCSSTKKYPPSAVEEVVSECWRFRAPDEAMSINLYLVIAVAAVIALTTAQSVWGRIAVFAGLLVLSVVGVVLWNIIVSRSPTH